VDARKLAELIARRAGLTGRIVVARPSRPRLRLLDTSPANGLGLRGDDPIPGGPRHHVVPGNAREGGTWVSAWAT
jgi:hypothetical protein